MTSMSASEARKRLFPLLAAVNADHDVVRIVGRNGNGVLMSEEDYDAWQTTMHLFGNPHNAQRLIEAYAEAVAGGGERHELIDPWTSPSTAEPGTTTSGGSPNTAPPSERSTA